ncbi:hypothetical protein [Xanthomonas fragariae]|uniref:hypothetical protein n=1 Tax=Xanthomonas fragariae TaxID=48664 RepID=UPI001ABE5B7F|nr:hypothetical protein [Xanthomonas fragariae]UKR53840.1 hypothetical protein K4A87_08435 [Xanthomonas fragariae]WAT14113.1 hypothetical protein OZ429_13620 [Xanthomonas fragariae]
MAFINEFITSEDIEKYELESIDKKFIFGGSSSRDWVIDREREMYLRNVAHGGAAEPEVRNQTKWSFYWRGELVILRLDLMESGGESKGAGWSHWKLVWINEGKGLPPHLKINCASFIEDLKSALTAHNGFGGAYSKYTDYSAEIDVSEGCLI